MSGNLMNQTIPSQLNKIVGTATVLALLYFGREILIPIALAIILSFFLAPLVRGLKRIGLGHILSVTISVLALTLGLLAISLLVGSQIVRTAASLPQYEDTIRGKLRTVDEITLGRLSTLTSKADSVVNQLSHHDQTGPTTFGHASVTTSREPSAPVLVEVQEATPKPAQILSRVVASVWGPLETAGIVFVVLIFVLLEHEALRDRFIRLAGHNNLRATTVAVNDAGVRLARFFASQFAVNFATGLAIGLCLTFAGVPEAWLWGALAAVLRFVPYVGVWMVTFCATLMAAAIAPGWALALHTLFIFGIVEIFISQVVEPRLFGHATGLSPLSVVISTIFWSSLWGPAGLVMSTPLTLCLVVAGRYVGALNFLDILLGDLPALTLPENFYQRALAGDAQEMTIGARRFLKRKSFCSFCDTVLMPALHLAHTDFTGDAITTAERQRVGSAVASMLVSLEERKKWWNGNSQVSVLDDVTLARHLRTRRENLVGQWQGPLNVPANSVILAIGLESPVNELAAEILVRVLRAEQIDGRHISLGDLNDSPPLETTSELVSLVCFVSTEPLKEHSSFPDIANNMRRQLPHARIIALCLSNPFEKMPQDQPIFAGADRTARSYEEILQCCIRALHDQGGTATAI